MTLHDKIMNLPYAEDIDPMSMEYKLGFRDARHAAAELVNEADEDIADLQSRIAAFQQAIDEANKRLDRAETTRAQLVEALAWYVDHDEANDEPGNEFYIAGREKARAALAAACGYHKGER